MTKQENFQNRAVAEKFSSYPENIRKRLIFIRQLIFKTAANIKEVGEIEETLKWGEPSYITSQTRSGSTIRIDWKKAKPNQYAIYFNCKTILIERFKQVYGDLFTYEGNRSIIFNENDKVPISELSDCIAMALTYHLNKKKQHL